MTQEELDQAEITPDLLRPENEEELGRLLEFEQLNASSCYLSAGKQAADAMDYYLANSKYYTFTGVDSQATTSQIVAKIVAEVVDEITPDIVRVLLGNVNVVEFEAEREEHHELIRAATEAVNSVFRMQRDFPMQVLDYVKTGLIEKVGVWEVLVFAPYEQPEVHELSFEALQGLRQMQNIRFEVMGSGASPDTVRATVFKRTPTSFRIRHVDPRHLYVSSDARSLDQSTPYGARYVGIKERTSVSGAILQWPDKRDQLLKLARMSPVNSVDNAQEGAAAATLRESREQLNQTDYDTAKNLYGKPIEIMREYIRCDFDADEYPELLMCIRVGRTILHKEPVDDNLLAMWTPYRIPDQIIGESAADKVMSLQDLATSFLRSSNDAAAFSSRPRIAYDAARVQGSDVPTLLDLMTWEAGAPIRTDGSPKDSLMPIQMTDVTGPSVKMLGLTNQMKEAWSGVRQVQQGLNPELLNRQESGKHFQELLQAANGRKEDLARQASFGMAALGGRLLQAMVRYGEKMQVRIDDTYQEVDPSLFQSDMRPIVHVSGAAGSRSLEMSHLNVMFDRQVQMFEQLGPANPYIGVPEIMETFRELVDAFGFRNPHRFVKTPPQQKVEQFLQNLLNQKDPAVQIEEMKGAVEELRIEAEASGNKYRLDQDAKVKNHATSTVARTKLFGLNATEKIEKRKNETDRYKIKTNKEIEARKAEAQEKAAAKQAQAAKASDGGANRAK